MSTTHTKNSAKIYELEIENSQNNNNFSSMYLHYTFGAKSKINSLSGKVFRKIAFATNPPREFLPAVDSLSDATITAKLWNLNNSLVNIKRFYSSENSSISRLLYCALRDTVASKLLRFITFEPCGKQSSNSNDLFQSEIFVGIIAAQRISEKYLR